MQSDRIGPAGVLDAVCLRGQPVQQRFTGEN